jgi:hypothetical protein
LAILKIAEENFMRRFLCSIVGMFLIFGFFGCASTGDIKTSVNREIDGDVYFTSMYIYTNTGGFNNESAKVQIVEKNNQKWVQVSATSYQVNPNDNVRDIKFDFDGQIITMTDSNPTWNVTSSQGIVTTWWTVTVIAPSYFLTLFQTADRIRYQYLNSFHDVNISKDKRAVFRMD